MKILLAEPDRDLLSGYQQLLTWHAHEVSEAFEGTQTLTKLAGGDIELLILDETLPRVSLASVLQFAVEEKVRTIVLLSAAGRKVRELSGVKADAYLSLPFEPEELYQLIDEVSDKKNQGDPESKGAETDE